jgi:cell division control protein 12
MRELPHKKNVCILIKEFELSEIEEKSFRIKLTVVDCPGFGDYVNNNRSWESIVNYMDDQNELYLRQSQQPNRQDIVDGRVHACLYFIPPSGHTSVEWFYLIPGIVKIRL